jgi:hypothetical protein
MLCALPAVSVAAGVPNANANPPTDPYSDSNSNPNPHSHSASTNHASSGQPILASGDNQHLHPGARSVPGSHDRQPENCRH